MINQPRSTRNSVPPSFPEELDGLESFINDQSLTPKSKLDEFRRFFDFKSDFWNKFHKHLKDHVLLSSSWAEVQESADKREAIAAAFLAQVGLKYWSKENQNKYLLEEHIQNGHVCVYPRDRKPMTKALAYLLEKDAKNRRESVFQDVPEAQSSSSGPLSDPDPSGSDFTDILKKSSSRASTPATLFKISQNANSPQSPRTVRSTRSASVMRADKIEDTSNGPASTTFSPSTRGRFVVAENALVSSAIATPGTRSPESVHLCCQERMGIAETFYSHFPDIATNMLGTYFLVHEDGSQREPVCVPFRNFDDYKTTDEFLDEMEKRCCCEHEPSMLQLFEDIRQFSHAVVLLQWSGVSFVMRRGTEDLQSLANRIGCAWRAKGEGELRTFEFVIRVTLKKD